MSNNVQVPGGYYLNPDGKSAHDADGKPVPLLGSVQAVEPKDQAIAAPATSAPTVAPVEVPAVEPEVEVASEKPAKKKAV